MLLYNVGILLLSFKPPLLFGSLTQVTFNSAIKLELHVLGCNFEFYVQPKKIQMSSSKLTRQYRKKTKHFT